MNENERKELIEAQAKAASALEDGAKFSAKVGNLVAGMVASKRAAMEQPIRPEVKALGVQIANPSAFWSGAAVLQFSADGDRGMAEPLAMATKYAAARLAAGDLDFVRESLLGQAQWCGVLAVTKKRPERRLFVCRLAERVGFEPTVPCSTPDFESGTFDHSATSPQRPI
jgi:hypothetical protein